MFFSELTNGLPIRFSYKRPRTVHYRPGLSILTQKTVHFGSRPSTLTLDFGPFELSTLNRTLQVYLTTKMLLKQKLIWCPNAFHNFYSSKNSSRNKFTNVRIVTYHQGKHYDTICVQVSINDNCLLNRLYSMIQWPLLE